MMQALIALAMGCSAPPDLSGNTIGTLGEPIVYGDDGRSEYFDAPADVRKRIEQSAVALMPRRVIESRSGPFALNAPSWGVADSLCPGEPFAEQTAAAFCSGVLVDWDLVLTAGHCTLAFTLENFVAVLGYHYVTPGVLGVRDVDVLDVVEVVSEARDVAGVEPRRDFAWLRLLRPARPPRQPAPVYVTPRPLEEGTPLLVIGAEGGTPCKFDGGGVVRAARDHSLDYFVADTDTSHGSSGGGAFDAALALAGILARGQRDFFQTEQGCWSTVRQSDATRADEQFTYAALAVRALCADSSHSSSICRPDCVEPCEAYPLDEVSDCAIGKARQRRGVDAWPLLMLLLVWRRRVLRTGRPLTPRRAACRLPAAACRPSATRPHRGLPAPVQEAV